MPSLDVKSFNLEITSNSSHNVNPVLSYSPNYFVPFPCPSQKRGESYSSEYSNTLPVKHKFFKNLSLVVNSGVPETTNTLDEHLYPYQFFNIPSKFIDEFYAFALKNSKANAVSLDRDIWSFQSPLFDSLVKLFNGCFTPVNGQGYYPTNFDPRNSRHVNIFTRLKWQKGLVLNPPFSNLSLHLYFLFCVSTFLNTVLIIVTPREKRFKFWFEEFFTLELETNLSFLKGVQESLVLNSSTRGRAPQKTNLVFLNIKGDNISIKNKTCGSLLPNLIQAREIYLVVRRGLNKEENLKVHLVDKVKAIKDEASNLMDPNVKSGPTIGEKWSFQMKKALTELECFGKVSPEIVYNFLPYDKAMRSRVADYLLPRGEKVDVRDTLTPIRLADAMDRLKKKTNINNRKKIYIRSRKELHCNICHLNTHFTEHCFEYLDPKLKAHPRDIFRVRLVQFINKWVKRPVVLPDKRIIETYLGYLKRLDSLIHEGANTFVAEFEEFSGLNFKECSDRIGTSFSKWEESIHYHYAIGAPKHKLLKIVLGYKLPIEEKLIPQWDIFQGFKTARFPNDKKNDLDTGLKSKRKFVAPRYFFKLIQPVFYIEQGEKIREIFNSIVLNCYLPRYKVKLDSLKKVLNLIKSKRRVIIGDCSDAYMLIKIAPDSLKFLGVDTSGLNPEKFKNWSDRDKGLFGYSILPFGIRIAVYIFCRMIEHFKALLNLISDTLSFIDDFFIALPEYLNETEALAARDFVWGWAKLLNIPLSEKNKNRPDFVNVFIGAWLDSENQLVRPSKKRIVKLMELILNIIDSEQVSLRELSRLVQTIASMQVSFPFGSLVNKMISRLYSYATNDVGHDPKSSMNKMVPVDHYLIDFFSQWIDIIGTILNPDEFHDLHNCRNFLVSDVGVLKTGGFLFFTGLITNRVSVKVRGESLLENNDPVRE